MSLFDASAERADARLWARFGVPVIYTPPIGDPVACTGIRVKADEIRPDGSGMLTLRERGLHVHLRAAEVEAPVRGGTLTLEGLDYPVQDVALIDEYQWLLTLAAHEAV